MSYVEVVVLSLLEDKVELTVIIPLQPSSSCVVARRMFCGIVAVLIYEPECLIVNEYLSVRRTIEQDRGILDSGCQRHLKCVAGMECYVLVEGYVAILLYEDFVSSSRDALVVGGIEGGLVDVYLCFQWCDTSPEFGPIRKGWRWCC